MRFIVLGFIVCCVCCWVLPWALLVSVGLVVFAGWIVTVVACLLIVLVICIGCRLWVISLVAVFWFCNLVQFLV